ncbi:MAG: (E)-4-hydroxy-3-methylbut-2-enyl-diphosphate synthase [Bacteroidota bacterium]
MSYYLTYQRGYPMIQRSFPSREVLIGGVPVGCDHPVRLQSMTKVPANDVNTTVDQCIRAFAAGADFMRIGVPDEQAVRAFHDIKKQLTNAGYNHPLIADIHYNPRLATEVARIADKVRINPGNFGGTNDKNEQPESVGKRYNDLRNFIETCREHGTAIRIGANTGSLRPGILRKYGRTPEALVESVMEYLYLFEELGFFNTVVSLKTSDPLQTIEAYRTLCARMQQEDRCYPLHTGVTEAGQGDSGRIVSALGISILLQEGIGDTIRVSLTEPPEQEIYFAKSILHTIHNYTTQQKAPCKQTAGKDNASSALSPLPKQETETKPVIITKDGDFTPEKLNARELFLVKERLDKNDLQKLRNAHQPMVVLDVPDELFPGLMKDLETLGQSNINAPLLMPKLACLNAPGDLWLCQLTLLYGRFLANGKLHGFWVDMAITEASERIIQNIKDLLQYTGVTHTHTTFISCPGCSRTSIDIQALAEAVKSKFPDYPDCKIAIMGCTVNGLGEMADAGYGLLGNANGKINMYAGGVLIEKNVRQDMAIETLEALINQRKQNTKK